jgi:DNA recombination protein RmuC
MTLQLLILFTGFAAAAAVAAAWAALGLRVRLDAAAAAAEKTERALREEIVRSRQEHTDLAARQRQELGSSLAQFGQTLAVQNESLGKLLAGQLEGFAQRLDVTTRVIDERLLSMLTDARNGRQESAQALQQFGDTLTRQLSLLHEAQAQRMQELRGGVETRLRELQTDNSAKLEEMRRTVDEKLHATLEQRLGESFKLVSDRLEQVHRGLGEMQTLAAGVGDLNRMLTGVKTRGIWGEVQLAGLLEQVLTPQQYDSNVATRRGSSERVEFAIRLPGRDGDGGCVWLPIDAKFPREDYERLLDAQERADADAAADAGRQLEARIKLEARSIRDKYLDPPHTTDFAVMFLPAEGLYAEVLRRVGLSDQLQRDFRVTIAGPTTLMALLNSLQMGFRTLAIEKRSGEVWSVLGAVKTEFGKFGDVLAKTRKKLEEATNSIGSAETRTRQIERKLRTVEALPAEASEALLPPDALADPAADEDAASGR